MIIIHGNARNADEAFLVIQQAADLFFSNDDDKDEIAMIAPQFLIDVDIDALDLEQSDSQFLYWSSPGWKKGNESQKDDRPFTISSFAVVDQIIQHIMLEFPDLEDITLLGNSAGGQFIQRFAAGGNSYAADIRFWYIFSNLSSHMYFSNQRPEMKDPNQFSIPSKPSHLFDVAECPAYNDYRYGLNELNVFMEDVGVDQLRENYSSRNTISLIGERDTEDNFMLDTSCSAMLHGENRYKRAIQFYDHVVQELGEPVQDRHRLLIVPTLDMKQRMRISQPADKRSYLDKKIGTIVFTEVNVSISSRKRTTFLMLPIREKMMRKNTNPNPNRENPSPNHQSREQNHITRLHVESLKLVRHKNRRLRKSWTKFGFSIWYSLHK